MQDQLAHQWQEELEKKINNLIANAEDNPDENFRKLMNIIWKYGILNRLIPKNPDVMKARKRTGRIIFEPGYTSEFYWRIYYAAEHTKYGIKKNHSMHAGYMVGLMHGFFQVCYSDKPELFGITLDNASNHPAINFLREMQKKAKKELMILGVSIDEKFHPIQQGIVVSYNGIRANVRLCGDGTLYLEAENYNDHCRLYDTSLKNGHVMAYEVVMV